MDYENFTIWLEGKGYNKKVVKDVLSRLKALERDLYPYYEIDEEYRKNRCCEIMRFFENKGALFRIYCEDIHMPIGKPYLSSYKWSLNQYISFREDASKIEQ